MSVIASRPPCCALQAPNGSVFNVGGGEAVSVRDVIHKLEALTGRRAIVEYLRTAARRSALDVG